MAGDGWEEGRPEGREDFLKRDGAVSIEGEQIE